MRYEEIAEIMKIIDGSSCDEVIVETGDIKLVVRRGGSTVHDPVSSSAPSRPVNNAAPPAQSVSRAATPAAPVKTETVPGGKEVIAPMTGTFYRAPSPDKPAFVEVGTMVRAGDPLCVIEVMKLFTTINAEFDGRIVQIAAENAELVEYGRVIFVIEPV
ncbi:MAG: acetyl-CoA carboxylase biotin carboxyl carrier protein [Bradyrhizobiaceae bacterium]|nr:MAG: acetyl-CoA carboxylase biotin carboxyl carrier protein [Bradyrhizobiaceae bacterium]